MVTPNRNGKLPERKGPLPPIGSLEFDQLQQKWYFRLMSMMRPVPDSWLTGKNKEGDWDVTPTPFDQLAEQYPEQSPVIVEGIARAGEVVNIIGGSKSMKSWTAAALLLSIANGVPWLGHATTKGRVLLIDNELRPQEIVHRIKALSKAMDVPWQGLDVLSLRGRLVDYATLAKQAETLLGENQYAAVLSDAHYRMMGAGADENSNGAMRDVYNLIDKLAEKSGAAWFLVHHSTKGDQSGKQITDVGAGAGAQSRAADGHVILRPHNEPDAMVLEAVVRSFPPPAPKVIRWHYPLWVIDPDSDPRDLRTAKKMVQGRKDSADQDRVLKSLLDRDPISANKLAREVLRMDADRCRGFLEELARIGLVSMENELVFGNLTTVYALTDQGYAGLRGVTPRNVTEPGEGGVRGPIDRPRVTPPVTPPVKRRSPKQSKGRGKVNGKKARAKGKVG